jgi:TonB family protein
MKAPTFVLVAFSIGAFGCAAPQSRESRPAPGEESIETASLPDEEVVPLEPDAATPRAPASERPCSWAKAWSDPTTPDPLLAGVGGTPTPERVAAGPIKLPVREPSPRGEIAVDIVIMPDGSVSETKVVTTTEPPWPEAEKAVLDAVKTWRYEPPTLGGTPIAVCSTVFVRP